MDNFLLAGGAGGAGGSGTVTYQFDSKNDLMKHIEEQIDHTVPFNLQYEFEPDGTVKYLVTPTCSVQGRVVVLRDNGIVDFK